MHREPGPPEPAGAMSVPDPQTNILETERLVLRRLTMEDLDALAVIYRDPEVRKYFPEGTLTYEKTKEELEWIINVYYGQYGFGLWATTHKETGEFIVRCGLLPWTIEGRSEVEVAYLLAKAHWGRGLGTEAAQAILDYGFEQLHLSRLICLIDPARSRPVKWCAMLSAPSSVDAHAAAVMAITSSCSSTGASVTAFATDSTLM
jgi:RimJ/RimL family protein N-acetyltransferase